MSDLLKTDEVKTFQKMKWGGGPVAMFWGLVEMNNSNKSKWEVHVTKMENRPDPAHLYPCKHRVDFECA